MALPQPLHTFFDWVRVQEARGKLEFTIKGGEVPEAADGNGASLDGNPPAPSQGASGNGGTYPEEKEAALEDC